ncbi:hybrid sensor histidine kinase/response regulator, partial [bacterium]
LGADTTEIEGTGLGLVLSQRLVAAMNGTLAVESVVNVGTTLTLCFPQTAAPTAQLAELGDGSFRALTAKEVDRTYSVLCIEDNPSNLRLVEVILNSRPEIKLVSAMEGLLGLEMARRLKPDIILLDLNLPDVSGKDVLDRLQQSESTRNIPIVVISADATPNQVDRLLAAGARDYLTKPLNINQFLRTLDKYLLPNSTDEEVR